MAEQGKIIGMCMVCGEDLTCENTYGEETNYAHKCEGGTILQEQGCEAYGRWLATKETVDWDEFFARLRREGLLPPEDET